MKSSVKIDETRRRFGPTRRYFSEQINLPLFFLRQSRRPPKGNRFVDREKKWSIFGPSFLDFHRVLQKRQGDSSLKMRKKWCFLPSSSRFVEKGVQKNVFRSINNSDKS